MAKDIPGRVPPVVEQEMGTLEVLDGVFCDIAARAIRGVAGVAVVGRAASGLFRLAARSEPVHVERGAGEVAFSVHLTVRYNVCIPTMMAELRECVTEAVEGATGYKVRTIGVTVDHILPPVPKKPAQAEPPDESVPQLPPVPEPE